MSLISRPLQIMLLAVGVLALVWLFALQGHSATSTNAPTGAPVVSAATPAAPSAAAQAKAAAAPTSVYHGAAPGVEGLTRAINKAHKAVATSQGYATKTEQRSNQASGQPAGTSTATASAPHTTSTPAKAAPSKPATAKAVPTHATTKLHSTSKPVTHSVTKPAGSGSTSKSSSKSAVPAGQRTIETQLSRGNVVALLFWNPKSPADTVVHQELQLLFKIHSSPQAYAGRAEVKGLVRDFGADLHKKIALDEAPASQVAEFGSITHGIQVYNTPTLLIIDKQGNTIVMNGVQDIYSIEQTIEEARNSGASK